MLFLGSPRKTVRMVYSALGTTKYVEKWENILKKYLNAEYLVVKRIIAWVYIECTQKQFLFQHLGAGYRKVNVNRIEEKIVTSCFSNMFNVEVSNKTIGREIYFDDKLFLPRPASAFLLPFSIIFFSNIFFRFIKQLCQDIDKVAL